MIGVYKITNPKGAIYIGSSKSIFSRWASHESCAFNSKLEGKIYKSLRKYGSENHKFEILENCNNDSLLVRERFWQNFYSSYNEQNLNLRKANNMKIVNGKRVSIDSNRKYYYLDIKTGIYYNSVKEISFSHNIKQSTIRSWIAGTRRVRDRVSRFIKV